MANTRKDHKELLQILGIKPQLLLISIPNKIAKKCRRKSKKKHSNNTWDMLRMFHPKLFLSAITKMKGK